MKAAQAFLLSLAAPILRCGVAAALLQSPSFLEDTYDFIIAGGGTAGMVLANRLSEDPLANILVIESGPLDRYEKEIIVPWFSAVGYARPAYPRNLFTVPQPLLGGRNISTEQARVLGGASVKNAGVWDRALPGDLDAFRASGIEGWDYDSLLPYFKKLEVFTPASTRIARELDVTFDKDCHGFSGPLPIGYNDYFYDGDVAFLQALKDLGVHRAADPTCNKMGFSIWPSAIDTANQSHSTARTAYYDPIIGRANLHVLLNHTVLRVLTETTRGGAAAVGVEFGAGMDQPKHTVNCSKEVIVTAGALGSPQILLLSGIGEREHLVQHNISVVSDVPGVGYNLQDQFTLPLWYNITAPGIPNLSQEVAFQPLAVSNPDFMAQQEDLYYYNRTGRWTKGYASVYAILPSSNITSIEQAPYSLKSPANQTEDDASIPDDTPPCVIAGYKHQFEVIRNLLDNDEAGSIELTFVGGGTFLTATDLHPLSRGAVKLTSPDPWQDPAVDPRYLTHQADGRILLAGARLLRRIANSSIVEETLQPREYQPGSGVTSDDDLLSYLYSATSTGNHLCGSCALLPKTLGGVVDADLRVYGVNNLRVADASIITFSPSGHMQGTVFAFAEKAADIIKRDWA